MCVECVGSRAWTALNDCIYSSLNREPVVYVRARIGLDRRGRDGRTDCNWSIDGSRDTSALIEVNGRKQHTVTRAVTRPRDEKSQAVSIDLWFPVVAEPAPAGNWKRSDFVNVRRAFVQRDATVDLRSHAAVSSR